MNFYVTPYHSNLIKDKDRISAFYEGIVDFFNDNKNDIAIKDSKNNALHPINLKTAFDIGCGSGILSYFLSEYFDSIIAIDIDSKIIDCAKKSFKEFGIENVTFINEDALTFDFNESADLIICEMLDTALIDEEEVLAIKNVKKYLNDNGKIIPQGVINIAEPISMERDYIHYEDEEFHGKKSKYKVLGKAVKFSEFDFLDEIEEKFKTIITFNIEDLYLGDICLDNICLDNIFNGIKITTFTKINENIICGPTPMFNPPLFIPINIQKKINCKKISVELEYIMGGGVETIKTNII